MSISKLRFLDIGGTAMYEYETTDHPSLVAKKDYYDVKEELEDNEELIGVYGAIKNDYLSTFGFIVRVNPE